MYRSARSLTFGVLILAGALLAPAIARSHRGFTAYVPPTFPHLALGDFDRDGLRDVVSIQHGHDPDDSYLQVKLSGSPDAAVLKSKVISVVAVDIDHDGDLDLVAVAPSGQLVVWVNDGRGRYALQEALRTPTVLSPTPTIVNVMWDAPASLGGAAPPIGPGRRRDTAVVATHIRPPTTPPAFVLSFLVLPALRAPPFANTRN